MDWKLHYPVPTLLWHFKTSPSCCSADNPNTTDDEEEEVLRFSSLDVKEKELEVSEKIAENFEEVNCN